MTHPDMNPPYSPLDSLTSSFSEEERSDIPERVEKHVDETSEDHLHLSEQPPMTPRQLAHFILYGEEPS